jgi:alpha-L-fucosidase
MAAKALHNFGKERKKMSEETKRTIVLPSEKQVAWADCEFGALIHLDLQVFDPGYYDHYVPYNTAAAALFNPDRLDTDQWIETLAKAGGKYAILTTKHGTGFTLFPSKANDFTISNTPYLDGKGDVVASFVASCKKYGVRPGLYYHTGVNDYYAVRGLKSLEGNEEKAKTYNRVVLQQLEELWSRYGEMFEIWFDGGCIPPELGGPDIVPLLKKYQPNAITFQSPPSVPHGIRWVGNERATAESDCWATVDFSWDSYDGITESKRSGNPWGDLWRAAEADSAGRDKGGWMWEPGKDDTVYPPEKLFEMYLNSVGRNCNFLLGMVIDNHGLFPKADADAMLRFGEMVSEAFGTPLSQYTGDMHQTEYKLSVTGEKDAKYLVVMEDITQGERVLKFRLDCGIEGHCVGHKRIVELPEGTREVTFTIEESKDTPALRSICLY